MPHSVLQLLVSESLLSPKSVILIMSLYPSSPSPSAGDMSSRFSSFRSRWETPLRWQ